MPLYPKLMKDVKAHNDRAKLLNVAQYVGEYIERWGDFLPESKPLPLESYTEGQELELSEEHRVNRFLWAEPLVTGQGSLSDEYKASIRFWETSRVGSAVVQVKVWYDANLNDAVDANENTITFTTVLLEKRNL